jgi:hypothetical protein
MTPISVFPVYLLISLRKYRINVALIAPTQLAANYVGEFSIGLVQ